VHNPEKNKESDEKDFGVSHQGYDPLAQVHRDSRSFNEAWLKSDKPLPPAQRFGFLLLSCFLLPGGGMFLNAGILDLKDRDWTGIFFSIAGLASLYLGFRGLWRVGRDVFGQK
jgi:hypothetical protein